MMETETIAPGTALALIETMTPMQAFAPGVIDPFIDRIEAEVRATKADISTPKGRSAIRSMDRSIAGSKRKLDKLGLALTADMRAKIDTINAERKRAAERLEKLQREWTAGLDAWEAKDAARIESHKTAIGHIDSFAHELPFDSATLSIRLDMLAHLYLARDFEEFTNRAADVRAAATGRMMIARDAALKRETEAAEAARSAAVKAEEDRVAAIEARRLRDKAIADQAAETARIAAENKAREEREAEAKRVEAERLAAERRAEEAAQAIREAAERAGREAQIREATAEAARLKAVRDAEEAREREEKRRVHDHERSIESVQGMIRDACSTFNNSGLIEHIRQMIGEMDEAKRDYEEFQERFDAVMKDGREQIDKRLADVKEAERQTTERANQAAAANAEIQRQAAIEAERQRVAAEASEKAAGDAKRAKDVAHRKAVRGAARDALVAKGLSVEHAIIAVMAIAKGDVPGATINY